MKEIVSTLQTIPKFLILTDILRDPKGYQGCFDSRSHHDRNYVSERWDNSIKQYSQRFLKVKGI